MDIAPEVRQPTALVAVQLLGFGTKRPRSLPTVACSSHECSALRRPSMIGSSSYPSCGTATCCGVPAPVHPGGRGSWVTMTDIDPGADVAIGHVYDVSHDHDKDHRRVGIPLADHLGQDWIRWYERRARVKGIRAHAEDSPDRTWIVVQVPAYVDPASIRSLLDTARALTAEADAAVTRPPPMAEAELVVREWWSEQSR